MPVIDTSLLVPLFDQGHARHKEAQDIMRQHRIWHLTGGVLAELTQVIRRLAHHAGQDGNQASRRALAALETMSGYRLVHGHDGALASRIFHEHPGLSYVDAWGVALALERDETLLSFDERQQRLLRRLQ